MTCTAATTDVHRPIGLAAPGLTHALLAPAGSELAVATGWSPQLSGIGADGSVSATPVLTMDLPAEHPFWDAAGDITPGVAMSLMTAAGEGPAVALTCCVPGSMPVTVLLASDTCSAAAALSAAGYDGRVGLLAADAHPDTAALTVPLPDPLLATVAASFHSADCDACCL